MENMGVAFFLPKIHKFTKDNALNAANLTTQYINILESYYEHSSS